MKVTLIALTLLSTVSFMGPADAGDVPISPPVKINCGDEAMKPICDVVCPLIIERIIAEPVIWVYDCMT